MESTYLGTIPQELSVIILSYLDNNYLINNLNYLNYVNIEEIFRNKYNKLYVMISKLSKDKELNICRYIKEENFWKTLYSDIECLDYDKITRIIENEEPVHPEIDDMIALMNKISVDVIYTCLLYNKRVIYENINANSLENLKMVYKYFNYDFISKLLYECFVVIGSSKSTHNAIIDMLRISDTQFISYINIFKGLPIINADEYINVTIIYILLYYSYYKKNEVEIYKLYVKRLLKMFNIFENNKYHVNFVTREYLHIVALITDDIFEF